MGNDPQMEKTLVVFHHQVVRYMAGMGPKRQLDGTWVYPPIGEELETVGLYDIGVYISHQHKTVAQYIENCPIMELCLEAEQKPGLCLPR